MTDQIRILLVEDNELDMRSTIKAAERLNIAESIDVARTGEEAMAMLRPDSADTPLPDLVLLDLNLPGRDGKSVLAEMKSDETLRRIPVVVLTTSNDEADVLGSYDLGANAFVQKPVNIEGWVDVASRIEGFWLTIVKLPK